MPKRDDDANWIFHGFANPNTTAVPDDFFDFLAPRLKEGELRVVLYMIRRTYGFKKDQDDISISQMMHGITTRDGRVLDLGTGLSKQAVVTAVKSLEAHRVIIKTANESRERGYMTSTYRLNRLDAEKSDPLSTLLTSPPGQRNRQALVKEVDIQQTVKQNTVDIISIDRYSSRSKNNEMDRSASDRIVSDGNDASDYQHHGTVDMHRGIEDVSAILQQRGIGAETGSPPLSPGDTAVDGESQPPKRGRGRPRKFETREAQVILQYLSDFRRDLADSATLQQSAGRFLNVYHRWGKKDLDAFIAILYEARSITKYNRSSIRGSVFAYFAQVVESLLFPRREPGEPADCPVTAPLGADRPASGRERR
jgi:hypothetical protein